MKMALKYINILFAYFFVTTMIVIATNIKSSTENIEKPYFDDVNARNVSTNIDGIAILKCRVKNKGNRTISWIRTKDVSIIAANDFVYSGDQRFSVIHLPELDEWNLKIEFVQQRDAGFYECQVNTEPKINLLTYLQVTAARARISGSQEVHVKIFSTISLSCTVNVQTSSIHWYHGSKIVNFNSTRGGISLETEKTDFSTTSRLLITRATLSDSGNYSCVPKDQDAAVPAFVMVHVINGEQPAAMQTSTAQNKHDPNLFLIFLCLALFSIIQSISTSCWAQRTIELGETINMKYVQNQQNSTLSKQNLKNQTYLVNCLNVNVISVSR